jgi:hypothetical protein
VPWEAAVLNAIYEEDFLGFSYGFRPKRGQHNALDHAAFGTRGAAMDLGGRLRQLGLEHYEAAFRENEIDNTVLPGLTVEDLKAESDRCCMH